MDNLNIVLPFGSYIISNRVLYALMGCCFWAGIVFILCPRFIERTNASRWVFLHSMFMGIACILLVFTIVFSAIDVTNQDPIYYTQKQLLLYILLFSSFATLIACYQDFKQIETDDQWKKGRTRLLYARNKAIKSCNPTNTYCAICALLFMVIILPIPWTQAGYIAIISGVVFIVFIRNITVVYRHLHYKEHGEYE